LIALLGAPADIDESVDPEAEKPKLGELSGGVDELPC